jgi:segregation and condensation protein A
MEEESIISHNSEEPNVKQQQVHDILFNREIGWQEIIYDLINTEQLDPWDVNITILTEKYMETILKLEETDFFVSSKVLLAASLLLRIKSEILLNKYIKSIDEILFGNKEEILKRGLERIELDEDIPDLIPRSPMPRFKKVTLKELIESLNKAIITENRRIKKEVIKRNALRETSISLPNRKTISIKDKINEILNRLTGHFDNNKENKKITYTEFAGNEKEKRIEHFSPLLHLENQRKVWLQQEKPFDEIHIWMRKTFIQHNGDPFQDLIDEMKEGIISEEKIEKIKEALEENT